MPELRDSEEARRFLLQGLWMQRWTPPSPAHVRSILEWALEMASNGQDLPSLGFLADVGHLAFGHPPEPSSDRDTPASPVLPFPLLRTYEDRVLGKFHTDRAWERAGDALRRYQGRDRARGLAFLLRQFAHRCGLRGIILSPAVLKSALEAPPEEMHAWGLESLARDGLHAALTPQYEMLLAAVRRTADLLGPEDISQLERGTALKPEGEQLAERQVLRAAHLLESSLPPSRPRPRRRRGEVSTHIHEDDAYPIGGFASLTTRGSLESLLHSQFVYMEPDERPDLFDIKYLRDELLYYARDENQFLRRRQTFAFVLYPALERTRFKDHGLEFQRGVLLLALLFALVRKLSAWLSRDALAFRFVFVAESSNDQLQAERDLLASLFREEIANGSVQLLQESEGRIAVLCADWARRSLCHALLIDTQPRLLHIAETTIAQLCIDGPHPALADADGEPILLEGEDPLESWTTALCEILQGWL